MFCQWNYTKSNTFPGAAIHNFSAQPMQSKIRSAGVSATYPESWDYTVCLRGANSSHKMLKHYLGGLKQLDSLVSEPSGQAATGIWEGGRERNGRETELCELH